MSASDEILLMLPKKYLCCPVHTAVCRGSYFLAPPVLVVDRFVESCVESRARNLATYEHPLLLRQRQRGPRLSSVNQLGIFASIFVMTACSRGRLISMETHAHINTHTENTPLPTMDVRTYILPYDTSKYV